MLVVAFIFFVDRSTTSNKTDSSEVVVVPESIISSLEQVQRRATLQTALVDFRDPSQCEI